MYNHKFYTRTTYLWCIAFVVTVMFDRPQYGFITGICCSLALMLNERQRERIDTLEKRIRELENQTDSKTDSTKAAQAT